MAAEHDNSARAGVLGGDDTSSAAAATAGALARNRALLMQLQSRVALRVLRVSQVDATELDTQLTAMLRLSLKQIGDLVKPTLHDRYQPEMTLALQLLMFSLSMWRTSTTYGLQLLSLKYRDERRSTTTHDAPLTAAQKLLWALLHFGVPYGVVRLSQWLLHIDDVPGDNNSDDMLGETAWKARLWTLLQRAEATYGILSLLNFLVFLYDGRYRSVVDRVLHMRIVYIRRHLNRQVSYDFQNRQMVWHGFTEFLLFLMPLINLQGIRAAASRQIALWSSAANQIISGDVVSEGPPPVDVLTQAADTCGICSAHPVGLPHHAPCGHVFCYTCIQPLLLAAGAGVTRSKRAGVGATGSMPCPVCGTPIYRVERGYFAPQELPDISV